MKIRIRTVKSIENGENLYRCIDIKKHWHSFWKEFRQYKMSDDNIIRDLIILFELNGKLVRTEEYL